jgi:hypothetical protein
MRKKRHAIYAMLLEKTVHCVLNHIAIFELARNERNFVYDVARMDEREGCRWNTPTDLKNCGREIIKYNYEVMKQIEI